VGVVCVCVFDVCVCMCVCVCVCACSVELAWFASLKLCQQTQVNCICRASSEIPFPHASGKAELCIILCGDKVLSGGAARECMWPER